MKVSSSYSTRALVVTAMLAAFATVLMYLECSVPFMPAFVKLDFSELPALLAAFALGPWNGALVCLLKNLFHLISTQTGGVGELCNFLLGLSFVLPAGYLYRFHKTRKTALFGSLLGAVIMGAFSVPLNYFVTYPIYQKFLPLDSIIAAYQAIFPGVNGLLSCLVIFNLPFTILKGIIDAAVTFLIYKSLSPYLKGKKDEKETKI